MRIILNMNLILGIYIMDLYGESNPRNLVSIRSIFSHNELLLIKFKVYN